MVSECEVGRGGCGCGAEGSVTRRGGGGGGGGGRGDEGEDMWTVSGMSPSVMARQTVKTCNR